MQVKLRDLLTNLYPHGWPSPSRYWPRLTEAAEAISSHKARIPWHDPKRKTGGLWQAVTVRNIPRGAGALNDYLTIEVFLPPTARRGPPISFNLSSWGVKSARAYRLLLNLSVAWWQEGKTFKPMGKGGRWAMTKDPDAYPAFSEADLIRMAHPVNEDSNRRRLWQRTLDALMQLERAKEIKPLKESHGGIVVLPPWINK